MVVPLLVVVQSAGTDSLTTTLAIAGIKALLAIGLIVLAGKHLAQPLFDRVVHSHQPDAFSALTLLFTLGTYRGANRRRRTFVCIGRPLDGVDACRNRLSASNSNHD